jgi:hypothetical protein
VIFAVTIPSGGNGTFVIASGGHVPTDTEGVVRRFVEPINADDPDGIAALARPS